MPASVEAAQPGGLAERPARDVPWNVVVTVSEPTIRRARHVLRRWGVLRRTPYFHVLVLTVADPDRFLDEFTRAVDETPGILNFVSHVVPAQRRFSFATPEEFDEKAKEIALGWVAKLASKSFHVRLHRRGFKGTLSSPKEERFLDETLLRALEKAETPGRIAFTDPDAILQIETIDNEAGLSLWSREDLRRHRFLGVD